MHPDPVMTTEYEPIAINKETRNYHPITHVIIIGIGTLSYYVRNRSIISCLFIAMDAYPVMTTVHAPIVMKKQETIVRLST